MQRDKPAIATCYNQILPTISSTYDEVPLLRILE